MHSRLAFFILSFLMVALLLIAGGQAAPTGQIEKKGLKQYQMKRSDGITGTVVERDEHHFEPHRPEHHKPQPSKLPPGHHFGK